MRVMIVDDSPFMRKVLTDMITQVGHQVIATAKNGREGVEKVKELKPDVVTMDIEMPIMNGLEALEKIMEECPTPVIMLSTLTEEGAVETLKALEIGAVDFMTKPTSIFKVSTTENIRELSYKLAAAKYSKPVRKRTTALKAKPLPKVPLDKAPARTGGNSFKKVVAIGVSTGGPMALQQVIPRIPANIDASVVVVQHMPPNFTKSLADRLNAMSPLSVVEAKDGEELHKGTVYIAPGDKHLRVINKMGRFVVQLSNEDKVGGHRPSVDVMMCSVSEIKKPTVGVIMTGMGSDGTRGLRCLKSKGGYVISQDEASSVVFGMPGSAIKAGLVDKVTDLLSIADEIKKAVEV